MKVDLNQSDIQQLEDVLATFKEDWKKQQSIRAGKWRLKFLLSSCIVLFVSTNAPMFWWLNIIVIGYFAGSLFALLRQSAKTDLQIIEHQKQLKLVRLLRKFQASPYSGSKKE